MDFYAIDVETANERISSICQIGIVHYQDGGIVDEWETLVDPCCEFKERNIAIHGISPEKIAGCPRIHEIYDEIFSRLNAHNAVCHGHFDRSSILRAGEINALPKIEARYWIDSSRLAAAVWEDFAKYEAKLSYICSKLGIDLINHNALSDARAAAKIVAKAEIETGKNFESLHIIQSNPKCAKYVACNDDVNIEGYFYGETIVFTGNLKKSRREAEDLALQVGCVIGSSVTKKTTLLVVGDRDIEFVKDYGEKSGKHKKAEDLIAEGHAIRIMCETDFEAMISHI